MALSNLIQQFPIVDPATGKATDYLMKLLSGNNLANATTEEIVEALIAREIIAGDGLEGGGALGGPGNITLSANASAILDLITDVQGSVLFRGAAAWEGLAPGTAGHFLKTNGAGADPEWAAGGGGSGDIYLCAPRFGVASTTFTFNFCGCRLITVPRDCDITHICFAATTANGTSRVAPVIYSAGLGLGNLLASGSLVTGISVGKNELPLTTPYSATAGELLWIGLHLRTTSFSACTADGVGGTGYFAISSDTPSNPAPAGTYTNQAWTNMFFRVA